jgi:hypothetical protein
MEKPLKGSTGESISDETSHKVKDLDIERRRFSAEYVDVFRLMINKSAGEELLESPLDEDTVLALIDSYARNRHEAKSRQDIGRQTIALLNHLEGKRLSVLAGEMGVNTKSLINMRSSAAQIIARDLRSLFHPPSLGNFSEEHVERFRLQINSQIGEEMLEGPLDKDDVDSLIELYGRTHPRPNVVGALAEKLTALLEGKSWLEVAQETNTAKSALHNIRTYAIQLIARNLSELFKGQTLREISHDIDQLVGHGILSHDHATLLKRHVGIIDEPLSNGQITRGMEACERVRLSIDEAKLRDRKRRDRKIENAPTEQQLQIVRRLLGNRKDAINPTSRSELVNQYAAHERKTAQSIFTNEKEVQQRINQYGVAIDKALLSVFQWMLSPKYSDDKDAIDRFN